MKVKLIKPYTIGQLEKPVGKVMDVARVFGMQLIQDGFAVSADPGQKTVKKPKTIK